MQVKDLSKEQLESIIDRVADGYDLGLELSQFFLGKDIFAIAVACLGVKATLAVTNPGVWETAEKLIKILDERQAKRNQ